MLDIAVPVSLLLQPSCFDHYFVAFLPQRNQYNLLAFGSNSSFSDRDTPSALCFWSELPLLAWNWLLSPRNQAAPLTQFSVTCRDVSTQFFGPFLFLLCLFIFCRTESVTRFSVSPTINKTPLHTSCVLWCCLTPRFLRLLFSWPDAAAKQFLISKFCLLFFRTALSSTQLLFKKSFRI